MTKKFKLVLSGRYRGIRRPLAQRTESEHHVFYRIVLTWVAMSLLISDVITDLIPQVLGILLASPIPVLGLLDPDSLMPETHLCVMINEYFLVRTLFLFILDTYFYTCRHYVGLIRDS